jgi:hypothetical protein
MVPNNFKIIKIRIISTARLIANLINFFNNEKRTPIASIAIITTAKVGKANMSAILKNILIK